jgi:hypothetical protein
MNIYDVISERFKGLDNLLEQEALGEDDWFNSCTKLTEVLLELAKRGTGGDKLGTPSSSPSDDWGPEIRLADTEELNGN